MVIAIIRMRNSGRRMQEAEEADYFSMADTLLIECLYRYRRDLGYSFTSFYRQSFRNRSLDMIKSLQKGKTLGSNYFVLHLDQKIKEHEETYLGDLIADDKQNPGKIIMEKVTLEDAENVFKREFTEEQQMIAYMKKDGFTTKEICEHLHISNKKVYYTLAKVKERLRIYLTDK